MGTQTRGSLASWRMLLVSHAKLMVRDRQSMLFAFVTPVVLMLLVGAAFGGGLPIFINVGVVDEDRSPLSRALVAEIDGIRGVVLHHGDLDEQLDALRAGRTKLVLRLPAGFEYGALGYEAVASVHTNPADPDSRLALTAIRNTFATLEGRLGARAFPLEERTTGGRVSRYLDFLAPGILGLAILNLGVMGAMSPLAGYRRSGALRRIRLTPTSLGAFVGSQAAVCLLLAVVQALLVLGLAVAVFGVSVRGSVPALLVLTLLGNAVFVLIGIGLASYAKTFTATVMIAILVVLPMIFLCGVLFPVNAVPGFMRPIVALLPLTHLNTALRDVIQWGGGFAEARGELGILAAWAGGLVPAVLRIFRWE